MKRAMLVLFLLALPVCSANEPAGDLHALYNSHQWFALRDAMHAEPGPALYRAALAGAFNDPSQAEKLLRAVVRTDPKSTDAAEARQKLEDLYQRAGQYRRLLGDH
jgi:hypothetical protein